MKKNNLFYNYPFNDKKIFFIVFFCFLIRDFKFIMIPLFNDSFITHTFNYLYIKKKFLYNIFIRSNFIKNFFIPIIYYINPKDYIYPFKNIINSLFFSHYF